MFKHYINIAIRNLLKYKQQSLISIIGLAVGVTCFAFCSYTLRVSMNWDRNIKDIDRICIIYSQSETGPEECYDNYAADALAKDFPEIESTTSYSVMGGFADKLCEVKTSDSIVNYYHETFMLTNYKLLDFFQIRVINGATPSIILSLFCKSNLIQLAVSAAIAFPLLGLLLNNWLQMYATHISISIFPFIILFLLMAIIVAFTIIWQLWRIARINPAEVIKSE